MTQTVLKPNASTADSRKAAAAIHPRRIRESSNARTLHWWMPMRLGELCCDGGTDTHIGLSLQRMPTPIRQRVRHVHAGEERQPESNWPDAPRLVEDAAAPSISQQMQHGLAHCAFLNHDILPSNSRLKSSSTIRIIRMSANGSRSFGPSFTLVMRTLWSNCQLAVGSCCRRG
jgi:hypothetical protein